MKKECWCGCLIILPNKEATKKEIKKIMLKIDKLVCGRNYRMNEWDYTLRETLEERENFTYFHDWIKEDEKKLQKILRDSNVCYRMDLELDCESCNK